ncbi:aminodeoxychorismate synthase, component I [Chromatium okenii]|uniref:aminodeoxychorismate synthase component I n=1 Tax=Chromatium okenii TaxID=61644 RepID=UPI001903E66C|nr:aminodeoxychorismate synthase component I [Chromatium okenii]MBK1640559.1 aminodeoxychorismate synthase, component I [Chromatium okenii]
MRVPVIHSLPYVPDSAVRFAPLLAQRWPIFLDSGRPLSTQGRYDILSADPVLTLTTRGATTHIWTPTGERHSRADPLAVLAEILAPARPNPTDLPFIGGAMGYFGYDLARRWLRLPTLAHDVAQLPELAIGVYDWALVVDHHRATAQVVASSPQRLHTAAAFLATPAPACLTPYRVRGAVQSNLTPERYLATVARIKQYLVAGDCYQVNFAHQFSVAAEGEPWTAYQRLRQLNPAPFSAYFAPSDCQVLCSSPERFLQVRHGEVTTQPIKGTRPRHAEAQRDQQQAEALRTSAKDRAENVMIVDLLRNDLGRVCATGSIQVPQLFAVEPYARVHHLVSTVTGRLAPGRTALDVLRASLPGGSITGAPKLRALEIIEELEPQRRGIYCGAMGYLGWDGAMDTNIIIRTLVHGDGVTRLGVGGGIVMDSDPAAEYQETWDKAAALLEVWRECAGA